ncbi:MAG: gamma-glutamyl-gamma-aminobutyrate hydrolase family protein [Saccharospirillum sp.]
MARPLIGITGPTRGALGPRLCVSMAIRLSGGQPVQLRPGDDLGRRFQGVVVTGGHDVHPTLYAEEPEVAPNYDQQRDGFESAMIDQALDRSLPLLGICRGAQLLNVRLGGSLFQDINPMRRLTSKRRSLLPLKGVTIAADSHLLAHWHGRRVRVNSLHNQAIKQLGQGLSVVARDQDNIIQAVESRDRPFLLGVQWHPEFLLYQPCQRWLFRRLVQCSR